MRANRYYARTVARFEGQQHPGIRPIVCPMPESSPVPESSLSSEILWYRVRQCRQKKRLRRSLSERATFAPCAAKPSVTKTRRPTWSRNDALGATTNWIRTAVLSAHCDGLARASPRAKTVSRRAADGRLVPRGHPALLITGWRPAQSRRILREGSCLTFFRIK